MSVHFAIPATSFVLRAIIQARLKASYGIFPPPLVSIEPHPEVENYLLAHQPYSHRSAMQGIATYVRANDERGAARK